MSEQAEQEQILKSDIALESAEIGTEEELSAISGGGQDNQAGQGAKTGAVIGAWTGGGYLGYQGAKLVLCQDSFDR
jgi:hypothetical protein